MKSRIVGIIAAKENSKRFPKKNTFPINEIPMFWHSVKPLVESNMVDCVYVATDSEKIKSYCEERKVNVIFRPKNACRDEDKLINILRFSYYNLNEEFDYIISIMANCPGHTVKEVNKSIDLIINKNLKEVRSFNKEGLESGILVFSKEVINNNFDVSYYIGSIESDVKEVHSKNDLFNLL